MKFDTLGLLFCMVVINVVVYFCVFSMTLIFHSQRSAVFQR